MASVSIHGQATAQITSESIDEITEQLALIYGVDDSDVEITVEYVTSGSLDVMIPDGTSTDDFVEALTESIANVVGVHDSKVTVTIEDDGSATYSVTGSSYDDVVAVQNLTSSEAFVPALEASLEDSSILVTSAFRDGHIDIAIMGMFWFCYSIISVSLTKSCAILLTFVRKK